MTTMELQEVGEVAISPVVAVEELEEDVVAVVIAMVEMVVKPQQR